MSLDFNMVTPDMINTLAAEMNPTMILEQLNMPADQVLMGGNPIPKLEGNYLDTIYGGAPAPQETAPQQPGMTPLTMQQIAQLQSGMPRVQQHTPGTVGPGNHTRNVSMTQIPGVNSPAVTPGLGQLIQGGRR